MTFELNPETPTARVERMARASRQSGEKFAFIPLIPKNTHCPYLMMPVRADSLHSL